MICLVLDKGISRTRQQKIRFLKKFQKEASSSNLMRNLKMPIDIYELINYLEIILYFIMLAIMIVNYMRR